MITSMKKGVPRYLSNEAGLGTGSLAHACADTRKPVKQGMFGIFEVFTDTIVICTLTALVISAVRCRSLMARRQVQSSQFRASRRYTATGYPSPTAVAMCCFAFFYNDRMGTARAHRVSVLGEGDQAVYGSISAGCDSERLQNLGLMWSIAETFNGLMAIPNLIALFLLAGTVVKAYEIFRGQ